MNEVAWLDVTIMKCPNCGRYYAEASWYAIDMASDIECGECGYTFNSKRSAVDRVLIEFELNHEEKAKNVRINMHYPVKNSKET
ncbi:hypothetical protein DRO54_01830 [Candidatus Bathyarchaeota archaeon]|nr:MAG: hypothetical protein DRO54_01830 [Candidatus Bathyarchaeota archaeon]